MADEFETNLFNIADIISSQLLAINNAQLQASLTTINILLGSQFIDEQGNLKVINIMHEQNGEKRKVTVPILSLIRLPFMRIQDSELDYHLRLYLKQEKETVPPATDNNIAGINNITPNLNFLSRFTKRSVAKSKTTVDETFDMHIKLNVTMEDATDLFKDALENLIVDERESEDQSR